MRNQAGVCLETAEGLLTRLNWLDDARVLVHWSRSVAAKEQTTYLVDLDAGALHQLSTHCGPPYNGILSPGGQFAVLLWDRHAGLVDLRSGTSFLVFSRDSALPHWTTEADQGWRFGDVPISLDAVWLGADTFVLTITPQTYLAPKWGQLLLVDVAAQQVRVLAEQGQVAAVLPDGALLVRRGWVDGPIHLFAPAYHEPPIDVAPGGPWTWGWAASPDGQRVAWLEWAPPPGDWSQRLPHECCSAEPHPTVRALALWERASGQVLQFPVSGLRWLQDSQLRWRNDGSAVLFTSPPPANPNHTALFQLTPDGRATELVSHSWQGNLVVQFEGDDGSISYTISGRRSQNNSQCVRRYPDGRTDVLCEGSPLRCSVDEQGRLITRQGTTVVIQDLNTGTRRELAVPQDATLSPDARWIIDATPGSKLCISRTR
jgi:hypothetical protein